MSHKLSNIKRNLAPPTGWAQAMPMGAAFASVRDGSTVPSSITFPRLFISKHRDIAGMVQASDNNIVSYRCQAPPSPQFLIHSCESNQIPRRPIEWQSEGFIP